MLHHTPIACLVLAAGAGLAPAGPYSPPAGVAGSQAIPMDSPLLIAWADGYTDYQAGSDCDPLFQTPQRTLGPAAGDVYDIASLGRGGRITLSFDPPISDGPGADFAVFENAVTDGFLELAYVEVSSDGDGFVRFPCDSLTPAPVAAFGSLDPSDVQGLAGTFAVGYGTPFDLAALPPAPGFDRSRIRWVRIVDVVGDGTSLDSSGDPIYDPYPTVQSAGFDLEAVGVIHQAVALSVSPQPGGPAIRFPTANHRFYQLEFSPDLTQAADWAAIGPELAGDGMVHSVLHTNPPPAGAYRVWIRFEDTP
jgi:hypothetical protein